MRKRALVWLGVICLGLLQSLCAQADNSLPFFRIGKETGLSHNTIRQVVQDGKGYLWIGTEDGLNRFDGRKMVVFRTDSDDPNSLSSNFIEDVAFDAEGNTWVATISGLNKLDSQLGVFQRFLPQSTNNTSLPFAAIQTILIDKQEQIWLGGAQLARLDPKTEEFSAWALPLDESILDGTLIDCIVSLNANELLLATGLGLFSFNIQEEVFKRIPLPIPANSSQRIISLLQDRQQRIWVTSTSGIFQLNKAFEVQAHYRNIPSDPTSVSDHDLSVILQDPDDYMWFGSFSQGLNRLDPKTGQFLHYRNDASDQQSLSDNIIWSMHVDQQGNFWVGTNNGLNRAEPGFTNRNDTAASPGFTSFISPSSLQPKASLDAVRSMLEDQKSNFWIGTDGGGINFREAGRFTTTDIRYEPTRSSSIPNDRIRIILEDAAENIYIGSFGGLSRLSAEDRRRYEGRLDQAPWTTIPLPVPANIGKGSQVRGLCLAQDGTLWIGSSHCGLYAMDPSTEQITAYVNAPSDPSSLSNNDVLTVYEDRSGSIWIGTFGGGINRFDPSTQSFTHFQHDPARSTSLSNNFVWAFHEDELGNLWIGTQGGLNCLPAGATGEFQHIQEKDGLPNNVIYGILEDQQERLWLSTNKGLAAYNPKNQQVFSYDKSDGLLSEEFIPNAYVRSPSTGLMYFGSASGYNAFDPLAFQLDTFAPPVTISALTRYREAEQQTERQVDYFSGQEEILAFTYEDNIITLDVSMLNFRQAHKNKYQYRLQGLQNSWFPLEKDGRITFTNLPAGRYVLQIRGANHHGVWQEHPTTIPLRVYPPWWWSLLAKITYLLVALSLLGLFYRYQLNRQLAEREAEELRKLDELKTRFFTNISHEFRTPLTMILGPAKRSLQALSKNKVAEAISDHRIIIQNGKRLLRLINEILDINKLEAGKLEPQIQLLDVISFAKEQLNSFSALAEESHIQLKFSATPKELQLDTDADMLSKILSNLLSNALRFTPGGGTVSLKLREKNAVLLLDVQDTGIGIPEDQLPAIFDRFYQVTGPHQARRSGTGIGLALTKELMELLGGTIEVSSKLEEGTTFSLRFPITQEATPSVATEAAPKADANLQFSDTLIAEAPAQRRIATDSSELNILIVEDNVDMADYVASCLDQKYQVDFALNGRQGLDQALASIPDLIITDVMMPEMDGFELCEAVKSDERTSHIPVIILTARAGVDKRLEGLRRGADAYLAKPFNEEELQIRVEQLLSLREQLRQRWQQKMSSEEQPIPNDDHLDQQFMSRIQLVIDQNLQKSTFEVDDLAREMGMSESQVRRKLNALTGLPPVRFIRSVRIQQAQVLLSSTDLSVAEVAYETGFSDPKYFSRIFSRATGHSPSDFRKKQASDT
ncbi:MAG: two-component regulator propeller domain-containing protein [Bacteroidota bacterium]